MNAPTMSARPDSPARVYACLASRRIGALPEPIRALLLTKNDVRMIGSMDVRHGRHWLARACARLVRLPREGRHERVRLSVVRRGRYEMWQRSFADRSINTRQYLSGSLLAERAGPLELLFEVDIDSDAILFTSRGARLRLFNLAIRLPKAIAPVVRAQMTSPSPPEVQTVVRVAMPVAGEILMYSGTMRKVSE